MNDTSLHSAAWPGWRGPLLILLLAFVLRAGALWLAQDAELVKDEIRYLANAQALLDDQGFVGSYQSVVLHPELVGQSLLPDYPGAFQPPLYTLFSAGILAISGGSENAIKFAQVVLGSLSALFVYGIGRRWFDEKRARLAAIVFAVYPNLIVFTHLLFTETLFIFLILPAFACLTGRGELPRWRAIVVAGALLGLAALTRAAIVYFVPVLLLWFVFAHRRNVASAIGRAVIVLVAMFSVIAPWTIRNYYVHDGFVLIDTNGPYNLWRGNNRMVYKERGGETTKRTFRPPFERIPFAPVAKARRLNLVRPAVKAIGTKAPSDLEIAAFARLRAWNYIRKDPADFFRRAYYKSIDMWNPTSYLMMHLLLGSYGEVPEWVIAALGWTTVTCYVLVMLLAFLGVLAGLRDPHVWLVIVLVCFFAVVHAVVFGLTRYRLPLMPFILVVATHGMFWLLEVCRARRVGGAAAQTEPS